jgi:bis(5'-nucleosyl)-tetraphosphatase (symmetrical)
MSTYAIGDVQGCWRALRALLRRLDFSVSRDELWFVGDLVNRGPHSADVLRLLLDLGSAVTVVLGNHDLHLLGRAAGARKARRRDNIEIVLEAPDRDDLVAWLSGWPLAHQSNGWLMVHAGVLPQWTLDNVIELAERTSDDLLGPHRQALLADYGDDTCDTWSPTLVGDAHTHAVLNALTRMRVCTPDGRMDLGYRGVGEAIVPPFLPWYEVAERRTRELTVVYGHWAAQGLTVNHDTVGLDSGCVWGGNLTALRLEDGALFQVDCA